MRLMIAVLCLMLSSVLTAFGQTSSEIDLMPMPQKVQMGSGQFIIDANFTVGIDGAKDTRIEHAVERFLKRLRKQTEIPLPTSVAEQNAKFVIHADKADNNLLTLGSDESYLLDVTANRVKLSAANDLGIMHGLETFLQLVRTSPDGFAAPAVRIDDAPRFPWRGLMIDVSRHFIPMDVIKRNVDGMAAVKLNVLHLHLSDNQGFRFESKKHPKLTGDGSDGEYFTQEQLRDLVDYCRERGIRVVPEFDVPGHTTAWFVGYPELASLPGPYQIERHWGIFDPAMDPTNDKVYEFLDKLYSEVTEVFPDPYLHVGGDEVNGKQWNTNPSIQKFMKEHNLADDAALQAYFNTRLIKVVEKHKRQMEGWDEILDPDLPKDAVIQSWRGPKGLAAAARAGYRAILSNGWYLDLGWSAERHYMNEPFSGDAATLTPEERQRVLGGEACMWAEFVDAENIDSRIWPRAAAIAERLWSPQDVVGIESMYRRMYSESARLDELGLTHNTNYIPMLRRIAGNDDVTALKVLADVVEPVKDYTRGSLHKDDPPSQFTPLNRLVDAVRPESEQAREFRLLVDQYLAQPSPEKLAQIRGELTIWQANDASLQPQIAQSFLMKELAPLSADLAALSEIGLQALNYIDQKQAAPEQWRVQSFQRVSEAAKPKADLLIMIAPAIQRLVEATATR
jgi:hexosaminidase